MNTLMTEQGEIGIIAMLPFVTRLREGHNFQELTLHNNSDATIAGSLINKV